MDTIEIIPRYCGPSDSANGGYTAGILAQFIDGPAKVRLKMPPPLSTVMNIEESDGEAHLFNDEHIVASASPAHFAAQPLTPPSMENAIAARVRYSGHIKHPCPECFVCGTDREAGDALQLFTGATSNTLEETVTACDWQPTRDLLDVMGFVQPEFVWAALDCPGYFGLGLEPGRLCLLGEMSAEIIEDVPGDLPLIAYGWNRGHEGRKFYAGSAIADAEGNIYARAEQTWIELK